MNARINKSEPQMNELVLIAEDEPEIAEILEAYLKRGGFRTACAPNGRVALEMHERLRPDLVILDIQMPELDGWQTMSQIRLRGDTPVLMLTAMDQSVDKLTGLRLGADDYVVKPFNVAEVVARTEAILRRTRNKPTETQAMFRVPPFEVDLNNHTAMVQNGTEYLDLHLTLTEFKLLTRLLRTPRRVLSREELSAHCLPEGEQLLRVIDSHVSKLRKKLENAGVDGVPHCVRGVGYKLRAYE